MFDFFSLVIFTKYYQRNRLPVFRESPGRYTNSQGPSDWSEIYAYRDAEIDRKKTAPSGTAQKEISSVLQPQS